MHLMANKDAKTRNLDRLAFQNPGLVFSNGTCCPRGALGRGCDLVNISDVFAHCQMYKSGKQILAPNETKLKRFFLRI